MKKTLMILAIGLVISLFGIGAAQAITIDGAISYAGEWDSYKIFGYDPREAGIDDNYNIKSMLGTWDSTDIYIRTDVYGIPTLAKQDSGNKNDAFYQWSLDTILTNNTNPNPETWADLQIVLELGNRDTNGNDRIAIYTASWSLLGYGEASIGDGSIGSIVEAKFSRSLIPTSLIPVSDSDMLAYLRLDNAGSDDDDRLPDYGWTSKTPEPGSAMLLVTGLLGFAGVLRRKFKA